MTINRSTSPGLQQPLTTSHEDQSSCLLGQIAASAICCITPTDPEAKKEVSPCLTCWTWTALGLTGGAIGTGLLGGPTTAISVLGALACIADFGELILCCDINGCCPKVSLTEKASFIDRH